MRIEHWRHTQRGEVYEVALADTDLANPIAVRGPVGRIPGMVDASDLSLTHVLSQGVAQTGLPDGDYVVLDPTKGDRVPEYRAG